MPSVSIIIPIYNVEKYLVRCLDSVINQTYRNLEIVLVNDCGTDNSWSIAQEYATQDSRIILIDNDRNHGLMKARESGFNQAKGKFIMFVDSDDTLPLDAVEVLVNKQQEDDADIVAGDFKILNNGLESKIWHNKLSQGNNKVSLLFSLLSDEFSHTLWGKLFKQSLIKDYPYEVFENFTMSEDACLMYQIADNCKRVSILSKIVYEYQVNDGSCTTKRLTPHQLECIAITNEIRAKVCAKYKELRRLAYVRISNSLYDKIIKGYHKDSNLLSIIEQHNLTDYINPFKMFLQLPLKQFLRLMALRIIYPLLNKSR